MAVLAVTGSMPLLIAIAHSGRLLADRFEKRITVGNEPFGVILIV